MNAPRAELGMYPFDWVRWAWDEVWSAVADRAEWAPPKLDHAGDVHAAWDDDEVIVNHVCGWPYAAWHLDDMALVGAFDVALPNEPDVGRGRYRSVLVTPHPDRDLVSLATGRMVVNSADSLSGALSLQVALAEHIAPATPPAPASVLETGAHIDSIAALLAGEADLGCVDAWTLAIVAGHEPDMVARLYRVGYGPNIPTPAITVRGAERAAELSAAFAAALTDDATEAARRALHIAGWAEPPLSAYTDTLTLGEFTTGS